MQPRVIIVGAGPVGLMTAIQAKLYDPELPILILEKYQKYQRSHSLILDQSSFDEAHPDADFQKFIWELPPHIRTNELEDKLLNYAKQLGIQIDYQHVTDCNDLTKKYPEAEIIIGADGSHSVVHNQVFDHQYQLQKTLRYIVEMKYESTVKTRVLHPLSEVPPVVTYAKHFVSEYVSNNKNGNTPISLRIFVNEVTYEKMQGATFKNPYKLTTLAESDDPHLKALYESLNAWLVAREKFTHEVRVIGAERISATNLPVYASSAFVKTYQDKIWALVGDAAFGVPYFRSLNNGILCSSRLAKAIHAYINDRPIEYHSKLSSVSSSSSREDRPFEYYDNYVQGLVRSENLVAVIKDTGVASLQSTATVSQAVPMSRSKLIMWDEGREYKVAMQGNHQDEPTTKLAPEKSCTLI